MELNGSTFVLEIINFLVLVWLLKRFLYKPVLEIIAARQAGIEKTLHEAETLHINAEELKKQYEHRLADWNTERRQAKDALGHELESERAGKISELQSVLKHEREKERAADTRRQADARHQQEETALLQSARFATRLLEQASGPDTEARLVELAITQLSQLSAERLLALHKSYGDHGKSAEIITVVSAFPLAEDQTQRLEQALARVAGENLSLKYQQDSELLAGLRISFGAWVFDANIQHELKGFAELAQGE